MTNARKFASPILALLALLALSLLQGCVFHSQATAWNGRVGVNGKPVNVTTTTKVGFKLGIVIPFLGNMEVPGLVDSLTANIKNANGDKVRIIQAAQENYWYGFPPFTWILTPVISTVTADFEIPSEEPRAKPEGM